MKKILIASLFLMILLSSLILTNLLDGLTALMIVITTFPFFFAIILYKKDQLKINAALLIMMSLMLVSSTTSSLIHGDLAQLFSSIRIYVLYISLCVLYANLFKNGFSILFKVLLISHIPLLVTVLNEWELPLTGVFYNPNGFGLISATVFTVVIAVIVGRLELKLPKKMNLLLRFILLTLLSLMLFIFTIGSSSRTSFITTVFVLLISLLFHIKNNLKVKTFGQLFFRYISFVIVLILGMFVYNYTYLKTFIDEQILLKFKMQSEVSTVFSGRDIIWKQTFEDASLFGHGRFYFDQLGIAPHNTFISLLGSYGILSVSFFVLFILISILYCFKYIKNNDSQYKYLPLFSIIAFILLSQGEVLLLQLPMIIMFISVGLISINTNNKTKPVS